MCLLPFSSRQNETDPAYLKKKEKLERKAARQQKGMR